MIQRIVRLAWMNNVENKDAVLVPSERFDEDRPSRQPLLLRNQTPAPSHAGRLDDVAINQNNVATQETP